MEKINIAKSLIERYNDMDSVFGDLGATIDWMNDVADLLEELSSSSKARSLLREYDGFDDITSDIDATLDWVNNAYRLLESLVG